MPESQAVFFLPLIGPDAYIFGFGVTFDDDLQNIGGDFGNFNFLDMA